MFELNPEAFKHFRLKLLNGPTSPWIIIQTIFSNIIPPLHISYSLRIVDRALSKGLIIYPGGPCVDGVRGDDILISPPFIITESQIDEIMEILDETITETEKELFNQIER